MPTTIQNLIVFGDSLSDIGIKWKTKSGKLARKFNQMYVNPTGRFSDCRNWTDFMFEEATGLTMVVDSAADTIALSKRHTSWTPNSVVTIPSDNSRLLYVNYAEGGACGDRPAEKAPFLGTFKNQVNAFEAAGWANDLLPGGTLFIIWFGANDLYTANRKSSEMNLVAQQIAQTQRNRLRTLLPHAKFLFVDMARPLTSVRYTRRVQQAETKLRATTAGMAMNQLGGRPKGRLWHAKDALVNAETHGASAKKIRRMRKQVRIIENLERGVLLFNVTLARIARSNGDHVAELGSVITEDVVRQLVAGNYGLDAGAATTRAAYMSAEDSDARMESSPMTTIDQVHPSERVYRLIWQEIYAAIKKADCQFGDLTVDRTASVLSTLGGPSAQTKGRFDNVIGELAAG